MGERVRVVVAGLGPDRPAILAALAPHASRIEAVAAGAPGALDRPADLLVVDTRAPGPPCPVVVRLAATTPCLELTDGPTSRCGGISVDVGAGSPETIAAWLVAIARLIAARRSPTVVPSGSAGSRPPTGATVLVVDDEPMVLRAVCRSLERAGYRTLPAESADDAERLFLAHPERVDLVLTDVVMPGGDGPSLVARLRRAAPSVRVLFMTGYSAGFVMPVGTLRKPLTPDRLVRAVREALDELDD